MKLSLLKLGNHLYERAYPLYRLLYGVYKAISDRTERNALRKLVQPGMTVIDIGANIGIYTRFLARLVGDRGRIIAFEPDPRNFERLTATVGDLGNVDAVHAAVSDHTGDIALFLSDDLNVDHRTYDSGEMRPHITIPAVSLDSFLDQGRRIDLIKIDVQGYEYQVLCGARRVLKENANIVLLIEFWPYGLHKAGVEPKALMRLIERLGFTWRSIDGRSVCSSGVELLDPKREDHYCNLLLVKSERRGSS